MKDEVIAKAGAGLGTGTWAAVVANFGLTWWAIAFAFIGVACSLYFVGDKSPKGARATAAYILVMGALSAVVAGQLPVFWKITADVPIEPRAFLVGVSCNLIPLILKWAARWLNTKDKEGEAT